MMVVRPARESDLEGIYNLAKYAGIGVTSLPADKKTLAEKLATSVRSFGIHENPDLHRLYLFVLEDTGLQRVVGTAAIDAAVGKKMPFYSYKICTTTYHCPSLNIQKTHQLLELTQDYEGKTELCTLFLMPDYRKHGNGSLLSRARFLFMAQFPTLFADTVFAEMRGVSNQAGQSPFWQSLGQHFFDIDFPTADRLTSTTDKQFIADLIPRYPIYVCLLNEQAQRVIGKPHQDTKVALKILEKEGFVYREYIDIFDAGPTVEASLQSIQTVQESRRVRIADIGDRVMEPAKFLVSNLTVDFSVCLSPIKTIRAEQICLTEEVAMALGVDVGDEVCVVPL